MLIIWILTVISKFQYCEAQTSNHWTNDFDQSKNCQSEDIIDEKWQNSQEDCVKFSEADASKAIKECKRRLTNTFISKCKIKTLLNNKVGDLLYCHNRGEIKCCIHNHKCSNYDEINADMTKTAISYLTDKTSFLEREKKKGFSTCHPIQGLDASICATECKSLLKTSPLLDYCNSKGGFLKCCVRREKTFCHECRYCCTLPFCTYMKDGEMIVEGEDILQKKKAENQGASINAVDELRAHNSMFKGRDNRCLKPNDEKDPENWDHYDPDDFYEAASEEDLRKAKIQTFDKNFLNFEDMDVTEKFLDPNGTQIWKETYGVDYAAIVKKTNVTSICKKHCMKKETSNFARTCRKNGGFFKCCEIGFDLKVFIDSRKELIARNLLESDPRRSKWNQVPEEVCTSTFSCTTKDPLTGEVKIEYETPEVNPIGGAYLTDPSGNKKRIGVRDFHCVSKNECVHRSTRFKIEGFQFISSRKEFCEKEENAFNEHNKNMLKKVKTLKSINKVAVEKMDDCLKRKSFIRICPDKILKVLNNPDLDTINQELKQFKKDDLKEKIKAKRQKKSKQRKKKYTRRRK